MLKLPAPGSETVGPPTATSRRRRAHTALIVGVWLALSWTPLLAHDVPADRQIPAFVRVDADRLELLVRIPLDTLSLQLPTTEGRIDVQAARPLLEETVNAFGETVAFFEQRSPLAFAWDRFRLSLPSDRSFDSYDTAVAHLDAAARADEAIYAKQGYLDARLGYPIRVQTSMFSVESRLSRELGHSPRLLLTFVPREGAARQYVIAPAVGRVALNPTAFEALRRSFVAGLLFVLEATEFLLLLTCVTVSTQTIRQVVATSVAVAVGYSMPLLGSALMSERVGAPLAEVVYAAGAVALVAVAFASIASLWCRWQWLLAGAAAVVFGQAASLALRDELPFAGTHRLLSTSAFSVGTALGYIVVVITLAVGTVVLIRGSAASRMRILLVSAIIADTAWHRAVERSTTLWQAGWSQSGPSLLILARWIAAVGLLLSAARYLVGRFPHTSTATARAQDVAADVETGLHRDLETRFHTPES